MSIWFAVKELRLSYIIIHTSLCTTYPYCGNLSSLTATQTCRNVSTTQREARVSETETEIESECVRACVSEGVSERASE